MSELASILRLHIIGVAVVATLVFGWLFTDVYPWAVALVVGLDWALINLLNRATDVDEDLANAIPGTERVARARRPLVIACLLVMATSFVASHLLAPALTPLRVAVQAIGTAYSYRLVPTPRGMRRWKDIYFLKNFMSAVLFVLTTILYPIALAGWAPVDGWAPVIVLGAFFVPFELTYEILYDLRDVDGDRAVGVPTYPVVHGAPRSRQIIDGLLLGAGVVLVVGLAVGAIGVREGLLLAAPPIQRAFYRPRLRRGLTPRDCILLTHLGTALLVVYLAGTAAWRSAGLPEDIRLPRAWGAVEASE